MGEGAELALLYVTLVPDRGTHAVDEAAFLLPGRVALFLAIPSGKAGDLRRRKREAKAIHDTLTGSPRQATGGRRALGNTPTRPSADGMSQCPFHAAQQLDLC